MFKIDKGIPVPPKRGRVSFAACRPGPVNGIWRDADWLGCRDDRWSIYVESDDSLQVIYRRKDLPATYDPETKGPKDTPDEDFWLYLAPQDAAVIGAALTAWAAAHGEKA